MTIILKEARRLRKIKHNPLEDIRALERTQLIIQNGVIVANYLAEP